MRRTIATITLALIALSASSASAQGTARPDVQLGGQCTSDVQCVAGAICQAGTCQRVQRHINLLYLVYRSEDRRFLELFGLYWHRRGRRRGFRVLFPFYWQSWSKGRKNHARVIAPFFVDVKRGAHRTFVVPPVQVTRNATQRSVNVWPLFFFRKEKLASGAWGSRTALLPLLWRRQHPRADPVLFG